MPSKQPLPSRVVPLQPITGPDANPAHNAAEESPTPAAKISNRRAFAAAQLAGLLHGPAEALPVSSSAHVALVGRLASGRRGRRPADPEVAKAFEVAAHAGTFLGLTVGLIPEIKQVLTYVPSHPREVAKAGWHMGLASFPAAASALLLERPIERRLGGDKSIAAGLLAGGLVMAAADAQAKKAGAGRDWRELSSREALLIGCAQACALWPGFSRSGAVLTATRAVGLSRAAAGQTSAALAGPLVGGATLLKLSRLGKRIKAGEIETTDLASVGAVLVTSTVSGYLAAPLARRTLAGLPLAPFAAYRAALAAILVYVDCRWGNPGANNLQRSD